MNTQNIKELEESQNSVISQWQATLVNGIFDGYVNTEDSMPFTIIMGKFDKESGLKFAQELANTMNISIFLNRIESWFAKEESALHLIYNIDPNHINNNIPVIANPNIDDRYGVNIVPQLSKKLKL